MIRSLGIRERIEMREETLSPLAAKSRLSRGRLRPEPHSPTRAAFQRDRDRIVHCNAFRRLKHKTQVFIAPLGDHYVTRLTHTLEVAQIARSIARALNLNEDLAEAISLGHDLGHTPFGHKGEDMLDRLLPGGFRHNEQSLRVVDVLEKDGRGLNLTWEVRDGIMRHSKTRVELLGSSWGEVGTLEGEVCKLSDVVAYVNHDLNDAIRAGILSEQDVPSDLVASLGSTSSRRINAIVCDIIVNSWRATGEGAGGALPSITMSSEMLNRVNRLRQFLFQRVYDPASESEGSLRASRVVEALFVYFVRHQEQLPTAYAAREDTPERKAADHIASMSDQYALRLAEELAPQCL